MRDEDKGWATLLVDTPGGSIDVSELVARTRKLEEVAALLALDADVSGVQTVDAAQSETQRPRLCVYTSPRALAAVRGRAEAWLRAFDLHAELRSEVHDDEQWREAWKRFYRPLVFGEHQLLLRPSWIDRSEGDPQLEVVLDPGSAFGTGLHQSTQLCLDQLCTLARRIAPRSALDLGTGSGVLAIAMARLFPDLREIVAVDIDPEATVIAVENIERNGLADRIEVVTGTLDSLAERRFDLVTANIRPDVLVPLANALPARAIAGVNAILSGILQEEETRVSEAWTKAGWIPDREHPGRQRETWCALHFTTPP